MSRSFVKPARRARWKMRKGGMVKQRRQKAKRSDRIKNISGKHSMYENYIQTSVNKGSWSDLDDVSGQYDDMQVADDTRRISDARRALERYMEERALEKALADDIY